MSQTIPQTAGEPSRADDLDSDEVIDVLSNKRRRYALHFLKRQANGESDLRDLSESVAAWEYDKPAERLDYEERKRVQNALRQFHLPKMEECGFVAFDRQRNAVELTAAAEGRDFYVDVLWNREVPWGLYYIGISAIGLLCVGCVWFEVPPLTAVAPAAWMLFFVTVVSLSSVAHFYDNYYRMRLGAREVPPEVEE
jgi:hypothetical protein